MFGNWFSEIINNIGDWFGGVIDGINDIANKIFEIILLLLPTSPFVHIRDNIDPYFIEIMGYVNYYVPIGTILMIMGSWLGCIAIYYSYQLILRIIKAVE